MNLAFLADENVETDIVDRLKSLGHTVAYASEMSPGRPDTAVLQAASQAGQVLITNDKDFGELVFRSDLVLVAESSRLPRPDSNRRLRGVETTLP